MMTPLFAASVTGSAAGDDVAVHHLADWSTWTPWTIASVWMALWFLVFVVALVRIARTSEFAIVTAAVAIGSVFVWASTLGTVLRHVPSDHTVTVVCWSGFLALGITAAVFPLGGESAGAVAAGVGSLAFPFIGIPEWLTRIASGIPTSVPHLIVFAVILLGALFLWLREQ